MFPPELFHTTYEGITEYMLKVLSDYLKDAENPEARNFHGRYLIVYTGHSIRKQAATASKMFRGVPPDLASFVIQEWGPLREEAIYLFYSALVIQPWPKNICGHICMTWGLNMNNSLTR